MSMIRSRSALSPNNSSNVNASIKANANGNSSGSGSSSGSSGYIKDKYVHELPPLVLRRLSEHLDELQVWVQLAEVMKLWPADVAYIKQQQDLGRSPSAALLQRWGVDCKHSVTELFMALRQKELHQAMRLLKDYVGRAHQLLIPHSQPKLSLLMAQNQINDTSRKLLNGSTLHSSSSGVSNSNNNTSTSTNGVVLPIALNEQNVREYTSDTVEIDYDELTQATENWSEHLKLGKGGFGTVYKGIWKSTEVAIKQLQYNGPNGRDSSKVQLQQSLNELKYLSRCRHDNVLNLYGYSLNGEKPCLVYQLMKGGTLEQRLYSKRELPLTWQQRVNIGLGTAKGINFLHILGKKPLIHGDIKPANVLLDVCLTPRLGDFGLAREGPEAVSSAVTVSHIYGTKPYLPHEFLHGKKLSTLVDTYSFGVMMLETFTGLRAYDNNRPHKLLTEHVTMFCVKPENRIVDLIDKKQPLQEYEQQMCEDIIRLSGECIAYTPEDRPNMQYVLDRIIACKPAFY